MSALEPFSEQIQEAFGLDMALVFQLQLALDEAVANVVNYAYGDAADMPLTITADVAETPDGARQLEIQLIDHGVAFNPLTEAPEVDTQLGVEERQIGGLGIFLIKQMMDELHYNRIDDKNILTMIKRL